MCKHDTALGGQAGGGKRARALALTARKRSTVRRCTNDVLRHVLGWLPRERESPTVYKVVDKKGVFVRPFCETFLSTTFRLQGACLVETLIIRRLAPRGFSGTKVHVTNS